MHKEKKSITSGRPSCEKYKDVKWHGKLKEL